MRKAPALVISIALTITVVQPALAHGVGRPAVPRNLGPPLVSQSIHHDVSPALSALAASQASMQPSAARTVPIHHFGKVGQVGMAIGGQDAALQTSVTSKVQAAAGLNVDGVTDFAPNSCNCAPPDTEGSVGTTQYMQWVNTALAVYDKTTGALIAGPVAGNILWSGFGGPCETTNQGDPIVQFDKAASRWVFTQFAFNVSGGNPVAPYMQCIAVSTSSNVLSSYNRYSYNYGFAFNDYPKLGVWPDAYYISYNIFPFNGSFFGALACALDRSAMLSGAATAKQVCFLRSTTTTPNGFLPSDLDGSTPPPAGSPDFFLGLNTGSGVVGNTLSLWKFHVDFATPANSTFTGPTSLPVSLYISPCGTQSSTCIPQAGTLNALDTLGDRLMYRLAYRNFGDHEALVVNHSVFVRRGVTGVRWYEIRDPNGHPTVFQQGTYAPDGTSRWMGSIAMDKVGDMLLGYSASSFFVHPGIRYTGRVPGDPLNTMESEASNFQGTGSQTGGLNRWGDYSAMTVDPVDDCTFWYTQEYLSSSGADNWRTRIASIKFPSCH